MCATVDTVDGERAAVARPDPEALKTFMAGMPAGVTIITTWGESVLPVGSTLSAVMPLSLSPPLMVACFGRESNTARSLARTSGQGFLIHVLAAGQEALASRFAGKAGDKFAQVCWHCGLLGLPQLAGCAGVVACSVADVLPGGDHVLVVGKIEAVWHDPGAQPLLYHRRRIYPLPANGAQGV